MVAQSKLFDRAADCERHMRTIADRGKRATYQHLRNMWIALTNGSANMPDDLLARKVKALEKLQADAENGTKH